MKKAIVIGGSGFLGRHLLYQLQKNKVEILAVFNKALIVKTKTMDVVNGGISAVSTELIDDFKPDIIFHCARPTLPRFRKFGRKLAAIRAFKLNKKLLKNIDLAKHKTKLVFASGSLMYGNSQNPHNELSPLNPISYAKQYFKGEIPLNNAVAKNSFPVVVLRFPWILGNGSWFKWFYLENIKKSGKIPTFGDLKNNMEIIDVENAAALMTFFAEDISESGIFNITSGKPKTQAEFVAEIQNVYSVSVLDSAKLFPKAPEKEAIDAFTSNIMLTTLHPKIVDKFQFTSLKDTLRRIKAENKIA